MENSKLVDEKLKKLVDNVRYMTREDRKKLGYKKIVPQSFIADKYIDDRSADEYNTVLSKSDYKNLVVIPYSIFKEIVNMSEVLVDDDKIEMVNKLHEDFLPYEPVKDGIENEHFVIEFGSFPQEIFGEKNYFTPFPCLERLSYSVNYGRFEFHYDGWDHTGKTYTKFDNKLILVQPIWWYVYPKKNIVVTTKILFHEGESQFEWRESHKGAADYLRESFLPSIVDHNVRYLFGKNRIDPEIDDILLKIRLLANKCPCKDKILKHTQKIIDEYNKSIDQIALDVSRESVTYEEDTNLPNLNLGVNNNASMLYTKFRIELLSLLDNINTYIDYSDEYRRLLDILKNYDKLDDDLSIDLRHFAKDILPYSPSWAEAWTNFIVSEIKKLIKIVESFNIGEFDIGIEPKTLDELITEFRFRFVTFLRSILKPPKDDDMMYERIRTEALKEARRAIANDIRDLIKNEIEPYEDDSNAICRKAANNILDQLKDHKITNPVKDFRYYNSMLFETCGVVNNIEDKNKKRLRLSNQRISAKVYEEKR